MYHPACWIVFSATTALLFIPGCKEEAPKENRLLSQDFPLIRSNSDGNLCATGFTV